MNNSVNLSLADRSRQTGERPVWPDLVRVVAIIMVLIEHTYPVTRAGDAASFVFPKTILNPDALLFFVLSGALLLPVESGTTGRFFRRRFFKIAVPFLVWSLVMALTKQFFEPVPLSYTLYYARWCWLTMFSSYLWFMFVLMGLYLLAPFVSPWLRVASRRSLELFLLLWLTALALPYLDIMSQTSTFNLDGFHGTWVGPFYGYAGYMVAGVYLLRYPFGQWSRLMRRAAVVLAIAFGYLLPVVFAFVPLRDEAVRWMPFDPLTLTTVAETFTVYILLCRLGRCIRSDGRAAHVLAWLSRLTFGVYLCHILLRDVIINYLCPWLAGSYLLCLVLPPLSFAVAWVLSRIPFAGKWLT